MCSYWHATVGVDIWCTVDVDNEWWLRQWNNVRRAFPCSARFLLLALSRSCKYCIARCCCWLFGWTAKRQDYYYYLFIYYARGQHITHTYSSYQQKWYKLQNVLESQWLLDLCNGIVKEGCIPEDWKSSVILPIYKGKGDTMECGSCRGISLSCGKFINIYYKRNNLCTIIYKQLVCNIINAIDWKPLYSL